MNKIKNIENYRNNDTLEEAVANYGPSEEVMKKTKAYPVLPLKVVATDEFEKVPDILTGGQRKRKYGAVIAMAVIPDLSTQQEPVMLTQDIPMLLVDGESLQDLEDRLVEEVKGMFRLTQDTLDGKIVPPTPEDYAKEEK